MRARPGRPAGRRSRPCTRKGIGLIPTAPSAAGSFDRFGHSRLDRQKPPAAREHSGALIKRLMGRTGLSMSRRAAADMASGVSGDVGHAGGWNFRILRILLDMRQKPRELIALIGPRLRHAIEILENRTLVDAATSTFSTQGNVAERPAVRNPRGHRGRVRRVAMRSSRPSMRPGNEAAPRSGRPSPATDRQNRARSLSAARQAQRSG